MIFISDCPTGRRGREKKENTNLTYQELVVDPTASVEEVAHAVELLAQGGSTEDDDRVGHQVEALPVPVHESVMVVGPATVLEFDQ